MQHPASSTPRDEIRIAVVGPCGSGKTTLVQGLRAQGLQAKQVAQEHSFVPEMWRRITDPDVLIYLDASYETCTQRKALNWTPKEFREQIARLRSARRHCDIYLPSDRHTPAEVLALALHELQDLRPSSR